MVGAAGEQHPGEHPHRAGARRVTDEQTARGRSAPASRCDAELVDHFGGPAHLRPGAGQRPQQAPLVAPREQVVVVEQLVIEGHRSSTLLRRAATPIPLGPGVASSISSTGMPSRIG